MDNEAKLHRTEQLTICVRYYLNLQPVKGFLCFIDCSSNRQAEFLCNIIKVAITEFGIYNIPINAHCYNEASVMICNLTGV